MAAEDPRDPLKGLNWKSMLKRADETKNVVENAQTVVKNRPRKKFREIPEYYFLPRRSLPSAIAFYGGCIAAGVGAGMLLEVWIDKKVKEDGGVVWDFDKK